MRMNSIFFFFLVFLFVIVYTQFVLVGQQDYELYKKENMNNLIEEVTN